MNIQVDTEESPRSVDWTAIVQWEMLKPIETVLIGK